MWPMLIGAGLGAVSGFMGSKGKNKQTQTQNQQSSFNNTSQAYIPESAQDSYYAYGNLLNQNITSPMTYYPGQGYIDPSQATQNAWAMQQGAIPYYQQGAEMAAAGAPYWQQAANMAMQGTGNMMGGANMVAGAVPGMQGMLDTSGGNYNFLSNAADVANNPYVQAQLGANAQQVKQQLTEQWLPQIQQQAVGGNALGSSRQGLAQAQGMERAAQQLANVNASTMLNAYGQGLGAQQFALGQTGQMLENQLAPGRAMYESGQMYGGAGGQAGQAGGYMGQGAGMYGQAGGYMGQGAQAGYGAGQSQEYYQNLALEDAMMRHQFSQMEPWQRQQMAQQGLNFYAPYAKQTSSGSSTGQTTGTTQGGGQNPWAGAIGGAMAGAGFGSDLSKLWAKK